VSEGHPDKIADQKYLNAILDAILAKDQNRVACETLVKNSNVLVRVKVRTKRLGRHRRDSSRVNNAKLATTVQTMGFDRESLAVEWTPLVNSRKKSRWALMSRWTRTRRRHQGLISFATMKTDRVNACTITMRTRLVKRQAEVRKMAQLDFFARREKPVPRSDYELKRKPCAIDCGVLSHGSNSKSIKQADLREAVNGRNHQNPLLLPAEWLSKDTKYLFNQRDKFIIGDQWAIVV